MGFIKIITFIVVPIGGMSYVAFSLGKELPKASRLLGNYIGLSYVYFKTAIKLLKPEDQMPYEILEVARKASQQSEALRREIRTTIKKVKEDINKKHEETMKGLQQKIEDKKQTIRQVTVERKNLNSISEKGQAQRSDYKKLQFDQIYSKKQNVDDQEIDNKFQQSQSLRKKRNVVNSGSEIMLQLLQEQQKLKQIKKLKKDNRRFFDTL